jgi:chromosome segregation ATPase
MRTLDAVRRELEEARAEAAAATAARVARDGVVGAELRDAQRRLAEWCASTAETELELERTKETLSETSEKLSAASDANESLREKRAAAEMDAADARAALSKAAAARDEAEAELARTKREGSPARAAAEALRRTLRDAEAALLASREETAALSASFRETEGILEEAVGRAEEETDARRALELALENRASDERARLAALDDALASERRLVAERAAEVSHLERRAVRAEDRLRETERQLAKARAEAAVGVALSAPPPGAGPFAPEESAEETPRRRSGVGANEGASSETTNALGTATRLTTTKHEGASSLRLELKARTRQTHKLQEVCAGLKRRFVDQGGSASAFELGKDVCEARYELKACEQKRLAERERAERLQRELEKTRRLLASSERNQTVLGSSRTGGLAARAVNVDVDGRHPRGEGKQTNGAFRGTTKRGAENAA